MLKSIRMPVGILALTIAAPVLAQPAMTTTPGTASPSATTAPATPAVPRSPAADPRGPAEYRTKMAGVMLARALKRARGSAR